jgi:hypothetical protein
LVFGERSGLVFVTIAIVGLILGGSVGGYYWLTMRPPVIHNPPNPLPNAPPRPANSGNNNGNSSKSGEKTYSLQLLAAGTGTAVSSSLSIPKSITILQDDDPPFHVNYQGWQIGGDFEPGNAWFSADKSGLTLSDQTCSIPYISALENCGPYWEWNGDNHEENVSELGGVMTGLGTDLTVFSIYVTIPYYAFIF